MAMRHGMTAGELALMFNAEADLGADLRVVPAAGWRRSLWFDDISIPWTPTSPNMPDLESASHYPGTCLFEGTGVSVGRGTNRPFQQLGAPWVDAEALKRAIDVHAIPGVQLEAVTFTPRGADDGKFEGVSVPGVRLQVADRSSYDPTRVALVLLVEMRAMAGPAWEWRPASFDRLAGTDRLRRDIEDGVPVATILDRWQGARVRFERTRAQYLLYP